MNKFTWTAKDKTGKAVVRELAAATAEEAKVMLLSEGCTDLQLREDEIMHAIQESFTEKTVLKIFDEEEEIKVTAADRIKALDNYSKPLLSRIADSIIEDKALYGIALLAIAYQVYRHHYLTAICFAIALLCWPAFRIWMGLPSYYYKKLNHAKDWNRWQDVLVLIEKLEKICRNHIIKLPVTELARCRAEALAGLGNLPQALEEMNKLEGQPGIPSWLHKAHIAGLYGTVKQHDQAIEYNRMAIAENPTPVLYADLMNRLLRYKRDTVGAREALAQVEKGTLTEAAKPFLTRCRGILAYLEGDDATAKQELEATVSFLERAHNRPGRDGHLSVSHAYLCCVLARQGDLNGAKKSFARAKEYLIATGEKDLLTECNKALGAT